MVPAHARGGVEAVDIEIPCLDIVKTVSSAPIPAGEGGPVKSLTVRPRLGGRSGGRRNSKQP